MYIGFNQDRNEFLKIKLLENYQGNYYENTKLPNVDKRTRYFLATIYIIAFISLGFYSIQNSLPVLYNHSKKLC